MRNPQKGEPLFSLGERQELIEKSLSHLDNVEVTMFSSLVVDLARESFAFLSEKDREQVFAGTALSLFPRLGTG